jgi:MFS family permease
MGWLVDRLSAVSVATCCIAAYAASMLFAGVTVHGSRSFGAALVVHGVVSGCYFTAAASMPQALLPRLRFGQFASAAGIVQAMATMAVGPITGQLLDWSGHNYRLTFYYASGLAAVGVVCLLAVGLSKRPADDDHPPAGFPVVPIAAAH